MPPAPDFTAVADLLPEPIALVRADGRIEAVNPAFSRAFGWSGDQLVGRNLADFLTSPGAELNEYLRHCGATSQMLLGGLRLRHSDGSSVECRSEGAAFRPLDGGPRRVLLRLILKQPAVARFADLTQKIGDLSAEVGRRRHAEQVAADAFERERRVRERLSALTEASGTLIASLAIDDVLPAIGNLMMGMIPADAYGVWHVNRAAATWEMVWQHGLSDAFGRTISTSAAPRGGAAVRIVDPLFIEDIEHAPMLAHRQQAFVDEGIRSLLIIPLRVHGDRYGTAVAYYRRRLPAASEDRHVAAALCNLASATLTMATLYDAESKSRASAELAEHRAEFLSKASAALASSLDYGRTLKTVAQLAVPEIADWCAVDVVDAGGTLRRLAMAHYDPAKLALAREAEERYPADSRSPYGPAHVMRTGKAVLMSRIPADLLVSAARDAEHLRLLRALDLTSYMCVPLVGHGGPLGVLTFVSAESRREYSESDVRFAEDVAWRAALAVENARAYAEAQDANRLKDEFLATLSHELRTPLNAVLGYARMLRSGMLPGGRHTKALEVIERNAAALNQIVEDILDVSRIVAGKIRLNVKPLDLSTLLREAAATVGPAADAKGVRIEIVVDPLAGAVSGDPDRLQQVVWNLLSNAVKFTPSGGRVQLRLESADSHVVIAVSDTGVGIKPEFLPHLFERFRQADGGFARERGGLGLGLAIARQLIEMHGGTITGTSEGEGRGATFVIWLPVMTPRQQPTARESLRDGEGALVPAVPLHRLHGIRVLAVDDDPDALALLSQILESTGAEVLAADSASAALDHLGAPERPHVIVSDIGMPGMDGFEFIRRVRESPDAEIRTLPAVALTAYARSEERTRALESGYQLHLAKPISPYDLSAAIRTLIQGA